MSYMEFIKIINKLGYVRIKCMWYHHLKFSFQFTLMWNCVEFTDLCRKLVYAYFNMKSSLFATQSYIVLSFNGPGLWPTTNGEIIHPPIIRRVIGRPKKKRNKANDEPSSTNVLPRNLTIVKCKSCGILGHNSRTCKGKIVADRQLAKNSNKAKKQRKTSTKESPTVLIQGS